MVRPRKETLELIQAKIKKLKGSKINKEDDFAMLDKKKTIN